MDLKNYEVKIRVDKGTVIDDAFVAQFRDSVRLAYLEMCRKSGTFFRALDAPPPPPPTFRQRVERQLRQLKWKLQGLRHIVCCGHGEDW